MRRHWFTRKNFDKKIIREISKITKIPFKVANNKFAFYTLMTRLLIVTLNTTAVCLMKIAKHKIFGIGT